MKPSSITRPATRQTGYALILMVLGLMGLGGAVIIGFTQQAKEDLEVQRYQHNQRVLAQAKQGLLMFAYNYPQTNIGIGPGRLPCPDISNDGFIGVISIANCAQVGRFPWRDSRLGTQELLDASGESLWYAVSDAFDNIAGGGVINYDTTGTITLVDQSGGIIYDGAVAGIAAVIIAPGTILKRDEDADGIYEYTQVRNTDEEKKDPVNYLDTFRGFDNSVFTNGESDTNDDGFILGPVNDIAQSTIVVNDQLIIITADEILAMSEMAVLEAYRDSIKDYLDMVGTCTGVGTNRSLCVSGGGTWNAVYPWLYNYVDVNYVLGFESPDIAVAKLSLLYPTGPGYNDDNGRIPTIFGTYFNRSNSPQIEDQIKVTLSNDYAAIPGTVTSDNSGNLSFFNGAVDKRDLVLVSGFLPVAFSEAATAPKARLEVTLPAEDNISHVLYFWDEVAPGSEVWKFCPDNGNGISELSDCHRDLGGNPDPGGANQSQEEILRVEINIKLAEAANLGVAGFDVDYENDATITITAPGIASHASIVADDIAYGGLDFFPAVAPTITATYDIDRHYNEDGNSDLWSADESGTLEVDQLLAGSTLKVEMRYFPQIPSWALTNGWHASIRMAYAEDHRPGTPGDCNLADDDCLKINHDLGGPRDKVSLLLIGHGDDWEDSVEVLVGSLLDGELGDELRDVFDEGNHDDDDKYYSHGNDRMLVIEEL